MCGVYLYIFKQALAIRVGILFLLCVILKNRYTNKIMKKTAFLFLLSTVCTLSYAQNYSSMWKEFDKAMSKDLPKTALAQSQAIYNEALAKGNSGQMLKAALVSLQLHERIAPDSAMTYLARLDSAAALEKRPVEQALFNLVLARLHSDKQRYDDPSEGDKALEYYRSAVKDMKILDGRRADEFIPATVKGADSKYFKHDLFNFVCRKVIEGLDRINFSSAEADEIQELRRTVSHGFIEYYRHDANNDAIVLATLDSMNHEKENYYYISEEQTDNIRFKTAETLIKQYPENTCTVEAYISICRLLETDSKSKGLRLEYARKGAEKYAANPRSAVLRNIINTITCPECRAYFGTSTLPEGKAHNVRLEAVNASKISIAFYRLPYAASDAALYNYDILKLRKKVQKPSFTVSKTLNRINDYDSITDSIEITPKQKGVYIAELTVDGRSQKSYTLLYVSNMRIISLAIPGNKTRMVVVDAQSGHPISGAKVLAFNQSGGQRKIQSTYTAGNNGEIIIANTQNKGRMIYFPVKEDDKYSQGCNIRGFNTFVSENNSGNRKSNKNTQFRLFTDRAVYRPGQKVHIGGIVYTRDGDSFGTLYDEKLTVTLRDANYQTILTREITSDEYGAFGTDLELPQSCLPGTFSVNVNNKYTQTFRVEEYKRPTFEIKTSEPENGYTLGDTVSVKGNAVTFTGVGVSGAKVVYNVKRHYYYWRSAGSNQNSIFSDTTSTDRDGNFSIRIPLTAKEGSLVPLNNSFYNFVADITVTSPDGESQFANASVTAGKKSLFLTSDMPKQILKSAPPRVNFSLRNASGQPVERNGEYIIYKGAEKCASGKFTSNKSENIPAMKELESGIYLLEAKIEGENDSTTVLRSKFTLFSLDDKRPADNSPAWMYASSSTLPEDSDVTVQIGSSLKNIVAFYDVINSEKIIESKRILLNDTIIAMKYRYKEEYGDGATVLFGFMHDDVVYNKSVRLTKPEPDKRLHFKWTTFRNRLQPGQKEEWSLNVYEPDGSPAKASAVATLYDASLDKFAKNYWDASLGFYRYTPNVRWAYTNYSNSIYNSKNFTFLTEKELAFDDFDNSLFYGHFSEVKRIRSSIKFASSKAKKLNTVSTTQDLMAVKDTYAAEDATEALQGRIAGLSIAEEKVSETEKGTGGTEKEEDETEEIPDIKARENFSETAFFFPTLKTDETGQLSISFTAPESMTRWNFKLLAHTKTMNIGMLDTTTVVAKEFMVQPNLPRYLRAGDKAVVSATVSNLTAKSLTGYAYLVLQDAKTEAIIEKQRIKFASAGNSQTVATFNFTPSKEYPLLICKITADAGTFADGEQHYLPVLSDETEKISTIAFTASGAGEHTTNIYDKFLDTAPNARNRRLTVEYTANPLWYVVQALPDIATPRYDNAVSIASAFYATTLEQMIARLSPELSKAAERWASEQSGDTLIENALLRNEDLKNIVLNETPWVAEANDISTRRRNLARAFDYDASSARARNLSERLSLLQQSDGGWSWYPGMQSNNYVTGRVLDMLVRLEMLTGEKPVAGVVSKGISYMDKYVARTIKRMKELERTGIKINRIDNDLITYLDILRRSGRKLSSTASDNQRYLLGILIKNPVSYDMYYKALTAEILSAAGHRQEARTTLQSLMEYTVEKPGMGRYFDTNLAKNTYDSYKIPTHVAAIEALRLINPSDKETLQQMLTWLIQEKRTQSWDNERNTVDAVYALLLDADSTSGMLHFKTTMPEKAELIFKKGKTSDITDAGTQAGETLGYIRADYDLDATKAKPVKLVITKNDDGISWGGIYYRALVPIAETINSGNELTVERTYLIERNGRYETMPKNAVPRIGDRIRVRYTVTASRDFDFVSLQDARPACFEPVKQTSGYTFNNGEAYYYAVRDASQGFFFEQMSKGVHTFYCDYIVDRAGKYLAGTAVVQCLYSPEFTDCAKGFVINTEQ